MSGEVVLVELEVLVAPVKFNFLSLGRLLERGWSVTFQPQFEVSASSSGQVFQFATKWQTNCGWVISAPASSVKGKRRVRFVHSLQPEDGLQESEQPVQPVNRRGGGPKRDCDADQPGGGLRGGRVCGDGDISTPNPKKGTLNLLVPTILLKIKILHDVRYQNPNNVCSIVYIRSCRILPSTIERPIYTNSHIPLSPGRKSSGLGLTSA